MHITHCVPHVHSFHANVFSITFDDKTQENNTYFATDGNPIDKMGSQTVRAQDINGIGLQLEFDVVKVTKPKLRPGRSRTSSMVPWCPNSCLRTASTLSSFGGKLPT